MTQELSLELKLDAGFVTVPIIDEKDGGTLGHLKFNPNDFDIITRYESVAKELESIQIDKDSGENALFEVSDKIKEQIDYLLNFNVSGEVFAVCNPLTLVSDGDFYVEKVLEGIGNLIEQVTNQRLEKKKTKIQKATAQYHK